MLHPLAMMFLCLQLRTVFIVLELAPLTPEKKIRRQQTPRNSKITPTHPPPPRNLHDGAMSEGENFLD